MTREAGAPPRPPTLPPAGAAVRHRSGTGSASSKAARAAGTADKEKTGGKDGATTASAASLPPFIPPDLSAFRGRMEADVAEAMQLLAEARKLAGRFRITSIGDFLAFLRLQNSQNNSHRRIMGAVAGFIGLQASIGSMGAADAYSQAALQKGDDAQRAFVASQPERQHTVDSWRALEQSALRFFEMGNQIFSQQEQDFAQFVNVMLQPTGNFTFS